MRKAINALILVVLLMLIAGCYSDRPHGYGQQRPPIDQLDERDAGLQSKDLVNATDNMAMKLLSLPALNASKTQWTIVATYMENQTFDPRMPYDIFIDRLKTKLFEHGHGRVTLIENKARFHDLQNRELEGSRDNFGQGGGAVSGHVGTQPDFFLYGKMQEMPSRATSLFRAEFNLTDARTRAIVWSGEYMVRVAR